MITGRDNFAAFLGENQGLHGLWDYNAWGGAHTAHTIHHDGQ